MTNIVSGAAGGQHVAGAPLTTSATRQASPDLLRNAIDERIVRIRPMSTPLDQISRCAGSRRCGAMTVEYYSVDTKKTESTVNGMVDTDMTVSHGDLKTFKVKVNDPGIFEVSETVLFPGKDVNGRPMVGYVFAADDTGALAVVALGDGKPADGVIPDGSKIVRMGRAATELDVQTPQFQALPKKASNHCQIFKMQVEQSTLQRLADKEAGWTLSDQEEAAVIDMRLGMEKNFLFGCRAKIFDPSKNEEVYLTGGIWNQTSETVEVNVDTLSHADLITIASRAFTDNNGSKRKIIMGGTDFVAALCRQEVVNVAPIGSTLAKWGLEAREIVTNFGHLYVIHSEIFDQCGHSKDAMVIDPNYITKYTHIPFHAEKLDLRRAGTRNTDAVVLTEASCLVLRYPKSHLRIVHKA